MTGDDDRNLGRENDDAQDYGGDRPRGGRGRGGGKGYRGDDAPPPAGKGYGKDDGRPPAGKGYGGGGDAPPPSGKDYGDATPPPSGGDYGDDGGSPYRDDHSDDTPPPSGKDYGDDSAPPAGGYGDGGGDTPPPPDKGYGGDYGGSAPPGSGYDEVCTPADPTTDDDPKPGRGLRDFKIGKARAETAKDIEPILEDIAIDDPEYLAKRKAIETAYAAATAESNSPDNLRKKYCNADIAFREAVNYMLAKAPGEHWNLLQHWIYHNLCVKDAQVRKVLLERRQVRDRLRRRKGPRELVYQDAREKTGAWHAAWTQWLDPVKNIRDTIDKYEKRIGPVKDLFNDRPTADQAIFEFWFEIAPLHLGLRPDPVDEDKEPGIKLVRDALSDFEDVQAWLSNAGQRKDGGLYLINSRDLRWQRERVLKRWVAAADDEAVAKADYDLRPDDAAKLGERYAGLRDDKWLARVRTVLSPPAAA